MKSKQILTSFFIQGCHRSFEESVNRGLKKRQKKGLPSKEEQNYSYSIYNFVEVKPRPKLQYYIAKEQLRGFGEYQKKDVKQRNQKDVAKIEEDIKNFKLLQQKVIQKIDENFKPQNPNLKYQIVRQQILKWFPDTDISKRLNQCSGQIEKLKAQSRKIYYSYWQALQQKMFSLKTKIDSFQQSRLMHAQLRQKAVISVPKDGYDKERVERRVKLGISLKIEEYFLRLVKQIQFDSFLNKKILMRKWTSKALLLEEHEIIAKKIKGKMLYETQEIIKKKKNAMHIYHVNKEYYIRQKKYSLHNHQTIKRTNYALQFDEVPQKQPAKRLKFCKSKKHYQRQSDEEEYERPKSKSQAFGNDYQCRTSTATQPQPVKLTKINRSNISEISKIMKRVDNLKYRPYEKNMNQGIKSIKRYKKPSPLSVQNIDDFSFSKHKSSFGHQSSINLQGRDFGSMRMQKLLKYPLKIGPLQIYSPESSCLCYHIDDFILKELTLKFIQDRLKMKENRIKIEYPQKYSQEEEIKVMKSLQILNCLGAEVSCQPQTNYKFWNEVDEIDILAASWVLELSVSTTITLFREYFGKTQTKK